MKLSIRALTIAGALLWGGGVLFVGLLNLFSETYGVTFLQMMSSVYPGFQASRTIGDVIVGALYGLVDGAICGFLFGWLYNAFSGGSTRAASR